ncbi:class I SAM-dependent methyltransferase [Nitratireductor sp. ZSWI3]|uniref:class I SAM-dependent methyltransferase n=1 Tax=Nitratireductor sp. ZSWI3 TaxID=2966359 RepID=UPI00214FAE2C|nr:class I SAM-dependent methyltransferase [Nitratireductor sp. ZSWI3]MCR4265904.1 class I SAM-dependent methyltransferase [Nitratireductor sp. ZSWI3]
MLTKIRDLLFVLTLPRTDAVTLYDGLAARYDRFHRRWLIHVGGEPLAALQGSLAAELRAGMHVLDAGCGTGALARWIADMEPGVHLTMADFAPAMLERAKTVPGRHVRANLLALPFADGEFDVVICTWALETTEDPERAVEELHRVLSPGGLLCLCLCTAPESPSSKLRSLPLRLSITHFFSGRFLRLDFPEQLASRSLRRLVSRRGLASFVCWRKPPELRSLIS